LVVLRDYCSEKYEWFLVFLCKFTKKYQEFTLIQVVSKRRICNSIKLFKFSRKSKIINFFHFKVKRFSPSTSAEKKTKILLGGGGGGGGVVKKTKKKKQK